MATNLPAGLSGLVQSTDDNQRLATGRLAQFQSFVNSQGGLQKLQLEQQFRAELAQAKTPDEQLAVAAKYAGPQGILTHADTQARIKATDEMAKARLQQTASHQAVLEDLARRGANRADATANYNTGYTPNQPLPVAPAQRPPAEQAAIQAVQAAGNTPARADVGPYDPAQQALPAPVMGPKPSIATMPPEIARQPLAVQNKWLLQQNKPSIAGSGQFTPQALNFTAKQYLSGDRQSIQGFARNATARIALQNEIVDEAARQGKSPEQVAALMAEFAGTMAGSRTVGQRAANISLAATEASEMIPIVKEQSDKFARTNFVPWNQALKAFESGTGSPEIAAFGASVNALVNVYARAINPTGVPTVSDKEHARAILNTVQSPAQVDAVLGIINRELEIAKKAPKTVKESIRGSVTNEAPAQPATKRIVVDY